MHMNGTLRENWLVLAAIATFASAWGVNMNRIANAEDSIDDTEMRVEAVEDDIDAIEKSTTIISTNQTHITQDIAEIKGLLKAISEELRED